MLDLGWSELLLIGIVALIVVGPQDLPKVFRAIGQFTGKARAMAREFTRAMNDAADEAGVRDIDRTIRAAANPAKFGADRLREAAGLKRESGKPAQKRPGEASNGDAEAIGNRQAQAAREEATTEAEADADLTPEDLSPPAPGTAPGTAAIPDPAARPADRAQPASERAPAAPKVEISPDPYMPRIPEAEMPSDRPEEQERS